MTIEELDKIIYRQQEEDKRIVEHNSGEKHKNQTTTRHTKERLNVH